MSQPLLEVGDRLNWNVVLQRNYTANRVSEKNFVPLFPVTVSSASNVIAAGGRNPQAPRSWNLAAWLHTCLSTSPSSTSDFVHLLEVGRFPVPLDRLALIHFPKYQPSPYLLYITFPRWHEQMYLEIWSYDEPESTTVEESLSRIGSN